MPSIRERISQDMKEAMKAKDKVRLGTLRLLKAEILKKETAAGASEMDEVGLIQLLQSMKKQRLESITQFEKGGREDLVATERGELEVIESLLPAQLNNEELGEMVRQAAADLSIQDMKGMGTLIKEVVARATGRADGKRISGAVKQFLSA